MCDTAFCLLLTAFSLDGGMMFYGPNVLFAFIGAMGVLMLVLSIMAIPHYRISKDEEDGSFLGRLQRKLDLCFYRASWV
jgi:hypothetical protein